MLDRARLDKYDPDIALALICRNVVPNLFYAIGYSQRIYTFTRTCVRVYMYAPVGTALAKRVILRRLANTESQKSHRVYRAYGKS